MFNFEIDLSRSKLLTGRVKLIESKVIRIGVSNKSDKAAIAKPDSKRNLPNYSGNFKVRRVKSKSEELTLAELLLDLEGWGLFTGAVDDPQNQDLINVFSALETIFIKGEFEPRTQARLENAARALIRNRIIDGRLGDNSKTTVNEKGFNKPLMDTGTLFTAIKAWMED